MEIAGFHIEKEIEKGWSDDRKYKAASKDGQTVLLRLSPIKRLEGCQKLCCVLDRLPEDLSISRPLAQGVCGEGVWTCWSWVNGDDAEQVIPALSEAEQYRLGYEAGEILRKLHCVPAPDELEPWEIRFSKKIDRKIEQYRSCPVSYGDGGRILAYVEVNRRYIKGRPQCFQHGDYHVGNMMLEEGKPVIIDFDRFDFGDPWEEFSRIVWCAQAAPAFAAGQIDGYFEGRPPEAFFRLLALYIAVNALSSLPWALPFGQEQIDVFLKQEKEIMEWYDGFERIVPHWYEKYKHRA